MLRLLFVFIYVFFIHFNNYSQKSFKSLLLKIDSSLEKYANEYQPEEIFLFTDKAEYFAGQTIWAHVITSIYNQPTFLSKVVYIELADDNGKIIDKKMLPVSGGYSYADFLIPENLRSGMYIMNAYTYWMKNFKPFVVQKPIFIVGNDFVNNSFEYKINGDSVRHIEFIPEGNTIADGIETNFVISFCDDNKLPVKDYYNIKENGKIIKSGNTNRNGTDFVSFVPDKNKAYEVETSTFKERLVLDYTSGINFKTTNTDTKLFISIDKNSSISENQFLLVAISANKICFQTTFDFTEGNTGVAIIKSKLPAGEIIFYLLDEYETVRAYRKMYNTTESNYFISYANIIANKVSIDIRDSVENGFVSIRTVGSSAIFANETNRIMHIESLRNQYQYFIGDLDTDSSFKALDQLLCLQKTELMNAHWALPTHRLNYLVESGISVKGIVSPYVGTNNPKGYDAEIWLNGMDSTRAIASVRTSKNGEFQVNDFMFKKEAKIYFQGNNPDNKNEILKVEILPAYFDTLKTTSVRAFYFFKKRKIEPDKQVLIKGILDNMQKKNPAIKMLDTVVVKSKKQSVQDSLKREYISPIFDDGGASIAIPDGNAFLGIWQYIRNNFPGININGDLNNPTSVNFNRYSNTGSQNNTGEDLSEGFGTPDGVLFFLNEIQVSIDVLSTLTINDVALIIINKQPTASLGAYNGYIALYTKKGVSSNKGVTKSLSFVKRLGFSVTKNYLLPENELITENSTIYNYTIDKTSKKAHFLKLPNTVGYIVTIGGWTKNGKFIIEEKKIKPVGKRN